MKSQTDFKSHIHTVCKKYLQRSNARGFTAIIWNWIQLIFVFAIIALLVENPFEIPPIVLLLSYVFVCLYAVSIYRGFENLVHEASHYNLFAKKKWNNFFQFLFAYPVFKSISAYREIHSKHHKYLGNPDKDPDLIAYQEWGLQKLKKSNFIWLIIVKPIFYMPLYFIKNSFLPFWLKKNGLFKRLTFWAVILATCWILNIWTSFLLGFIIPFFGGLSIVRFWCEASEHLGFDLNEYLPNSRNNIGFLQSLMYPFNDGYHQIHHIAPYIPWYLLPKVHKELMEDSIYRDKVQNSKGYIHTFKLMLKKTIFIKLIKNKYL